MSDALPPPLPVWFRLPDPAEAHRAALKAWRHVATGTVLIELWFPDEHQAGRGVVAWELRHPAGIRQRIDRSWWPRKNLLKQAETLIAELQAQLPGELL